MAVRPLDRTREEGRPRAGARGSVVPWLVAALDGAMAGVLVVAAIALPTIFSVENADVFAMPKAIVAVGLAAVLAPMVAARWLLARWTLDDARRTPLLWALLAFVVLNLVAAWFAINPRHALFGERLQYQGLGTTLAYVVYLVAAWTAIRTDGRRGLLLWGVTVSATVAAIYALMQRADLDPIWNILIEDRVFSTMGQPNWLAAIFVIALPLTIALAAGRPLVVQLLVIGVVLLQLAALAFTLSRGAFIGTALVALVLLAGVVWRRRVVVSRRGATLTAMAIALVAAAVIALPQTRAAASSVVERIGMIDDVRERSASAHLDQWAVGVAIIADYPLIGAGQDSYVLLFGDYRDEVLPPDRAEIWRRYRPESPHNHFLAVAGGAGLPALAAYLAIIGAAVVRGVSDVSRTVNARTAIVGIAFLAAIAGHLVTDAFITAEPAGSVLFWIILGATAALGAGSAAEPRHERLTTA